MRGILFHSSNLIFATQSEDPADPKKPLAASIRDLREGLYRLAGRRKRRRHAGRIRRTSLEARTPLFKRPPVPVDRADYRKFVQGLRAAGQAALKAAQSKNMDNMIEVSGTVSEACENCHSVYRDKPDLKSRCLP